jgi:hypothetical protein
VTLSVPVDDRPRMLPLRIATLGALAVGRSAATWTLTVVDFVRPQLVPLTWTWYVPGFAVAGAVTRTETVLAVHPKALEVAITAVHPDGTLSTRNLTRSKKVELREIVTGTKVEPPFDPILPVVGAEIEKVPSDPIRDTPSSGS